MGEEELEFLLAKGELPPTQPYQAVIEGTRGRRYAEKFLRGTKFVDSQPVAVVEFHVPRATIKELFERQHKAEDGAVSMGLGFAAGRGLPLFNTALKEHGSFRIVLIKRRGSR